MEPASVLVVRCWFSNLTWVTHTLTSGSDVGSSNVGVAHARGCAPAARGHRGDRVADRESVKA